MQGNQWTGQRPDVVHGNGKQHAGAKNARFARCQKTVFSRCQKCRFRHFKMQKPHQETPVAEFGNAPILKHLVTNSKEKSLHSPSTNAKTCFRKCTKRIWKTHDTSFEKGGKCRFWRCQQCVASNAFPSSGYWAVPELVAIQLQFFCDF